MHLKINNLSDYNDFKVIYMCIIQSIYYILFMWQDIKIDCAVDIGWALDTIGWICALIPNLGYATGYVAN